MYKYSQHTPKYSYNAQKYSLYILKYSQHTPNYSQNTQNGNVYRLKAKMVVILVIVKGDSKILPTYPKLLLLCPKSTPIIPKSTLNIR